MSLAGSEYQLQGKTALITGGGSGVGLECAKLFSTHGVNIMLVGRDAAKLVTACELLAEINSDIGVSHTVGNVSDSVTADTAIQNGGKLGGGVDILINCAGTILRKDAASTSDAQWQDVMAVNVSGTFYFSRAFANQQIEGGAIVNVSSTCGQVGAAGLAAYCASKGAVDQLTRSMALELAPLKITVNAVAPGAINSPMLYSKQAGGVQDQSIVDRNLKAIPIGTIAQPWEIARAIKFLAVERHITGTILSIDGGYTAQ